MRVFKRLSLAVKAAGKGPYVRVKIGGDKIYLVPDEGEALDPLDGIELLAAEAPSGSREVAGHVNFGHLDRLGNANGAAGAEYVQRPGHYAFPFEKRRGLLHKFINPADAEKFADDKAPKCDCGKPVMKDFKVCVDCAVDAVEAIEAGEY